MVVNFAVEEEEEEVECVTGGGPHLVIPAPLAIHVHLLHAGVRDQGHTVVVIILHLQNSKGDTLDRYHLKRGGIAKRGRTHLDRGAAARHHLRGGLQARREMGLGGAGVPAEAAVHRHLGGAGALQIGPLARDSSAWVESYSLRSLLRSFCVF
ncbi:unnamed protein product [Linum trigynum]|uniref:Uncharacterized protein n=1 Tax=Linum trigynum TaxID=586398 RepID=A0AAV2CVD1_9ROSI